jgi:hypothetical protein
VSNSNFPGQVDQFFDPVPTTQFDDQNNPHHLIETRQNDAINALEIKVGVNGSADSNSLDFKIDQMIRANGWLGGIVPNASEFQSPVAFDAGLTTMEVTPAFVPANVEAGAVLIINPVGGSNGPFLSIAQLAGPSGARTLVRAVALGVSTDGLDVCTDTAGPVNLIDPASAKLKVTALTNPNNLNYFLAGSNPPSWVIPTASGGGSSFLTVYNAFTIPAIGATVVVTVVAAADIVAGGAYFLTDGTNIMNAVCVSVAGTSITFRNVGAGSPGSGSMAGGHVYAGNVAGPATATQGGSVPTPPNAIGKWFRGDATFAGIAFSDVMNALGYTPANKAGDEFTGFVIFDAGVKLQTAGALYLVVPTVAPTSPNASSGQIQLSNVSGDGLGPTLSLSRVGAGGSKLNAVMLYVDSSGLGVVTDTAGPQNIVTPAARLNAAALSNPANGNLFLAGSAPPNFIAVPYSALSGIPASFPPAAHGSTHVGSDLIPAPTISAPGLLPALPPASGNNSQTKTWLRADATYQTLPEFAYLSAGFTVPTLGTAITVQFYGPPYPAWPAIGMGTVYFSDGTTSGWLAISSYTLATGQLILINRGNATVGAVVAADCLVRLGAPPLVDATQPGLMPKLGNTGKNWFRDDGVQAIPSRYSAGDSTNNNAYVITVASDFSLVAGVVVYFYVYNQNTGNPTLNVNGTGAFPIVTRANVAIGPIEITAQKWHGVMYDGSNRWIMLSPIKRRYAALNVANPTIECNGFDSVGVYLTVNNATYGQGITFNHLAEGVPVTIMILNQAPGSLPWFIQCTDPNGGAIPVYACPSSGVTATGIINLSSATQPPNIGSGLGVLYNGQVAGNNLFMK